MSQTVCHRIVSVKESGSDNWAIMTKGDANKHDDKWLLASGQFWINPGRLKGLIWVRIPFLGLPVLYIKETLIGKVIIMKTSSKEKQLTINGLNL